MKVHRISREPQPIADQWMLRCSCGWRHAVSLMDPALVTVADIRGALERAEAEHLRLTHWNPLWPLPLNNITIRGECALNEFRCLTFGWLPLMTREGWRQ